MQTEPILRYRGRDITAADVDFIRGLIAAHPTEHRQSLSKLLCTAWNWKQENGALRDMVARGLMLALHRANQIELPPVRRPALDQSARRRVPALIEVDQTPIKCTLRELPRLVWRQVRREADEPLFNSLMQHQHYLKYVQPVGEHLKFMVYAGERPVALFAWSSAPRHLAPRDLYLGWSAQKRRQNIRYVAYNTRYLVLPWVDVRYLASHLLSAMTRRLSQEWQDAYGHPVYFAETFVDPTRHRSTCYRAANWVYLGMTTGRGKNDQTFKANRSLKEVLGLALVKDFRERLSA
jgi:hypothetical protein